MLFPFDSVEVESGHINYLEAYWEGVQRETFAGVFGADFIAMELFLHYVTLLRVVLWRKIKKQKSHK